MSGSFPHSHIEENRKVDKSVYLCHVTTREALLNRLTEAIPNGHQLVGTTREAFAYLVSKRYHRQDAMYRLHYPKGHRSMDRVRFKRGTMSESAMADRLLTCGFIEVIPGIWTKATPSVTSHLHESTNG